MTCSRRVTGQLSHILCRPWMITFCPHQLQCGYLPVSRFSTGLAARFGVSSDRRRSEPRSFPTHGFTPVDPDLVFEEESVPDYRPDYFYPTKLGEVFLNRYQVVCKLGFGTSSTIWLGRDLENHDYVALKVYVHNAKNRMELQLYDRLSSVLSSSHKGARNIRKLLNSFQITGPFGSHMVLVHQVSQMSLRNMDKVFMNDRGFDELFVKGAMQELLKAVDFLHTEVQAVHTDIHANNLLLGSRDNSMFKTLDNIERSNPTPRKVSPERTIYSSRLMKPKAGPLLLADFGETRLGPGPHAGDIMPIIYRAPETLLRIQWSYAVDIWSVGLTAWDLLEAKPLFTALKDDGTFSDGVHLAELIAMLGPPPPEFLARNEKRALEYWDKAGKWGEFVPIPVGRTLERAETKLQDNTKFLQFMRRILTWDPRERPSAKELLQDPWLQ